MDSLKKVLITGLLTGYLPIAPGTWGSGAVAGTFVLVGLTGGQGYGVVATMAAVAVAASILCVLLGGFAERAFGRKDPSQCTLDEWAGQAVSCLLLPIGSGTWGVLLPAGASFLAFRFFDIVKPPPARGIQKLPGGWGILLDDLMAGAYANVLCQVIFRGILRW